MPNTETPTENAQQQERERRIVEPRRITTATPQRMQRNRAKAEAAPPTIAELQERQDAMGTTRRRTKVEQETSALDEVNEEALPVPDVDPTSCDE
ncbi:MAG TPA: hypothetical protein VGD79_03345 [Thermoanaerobaculia bacterium]|jgi:hypothetical protein